MIWSGRSDPDGFVPVVPPGLRRRDALEALVYMSNIDENGAKVYEIHEGQWISRDHVAAAHNPAMFRAVR